MTTPPPSDSPQWKIERIAVERDAYIGSTVHITQPPLPPPPATPAFAVPYQRNPLFVGRSADLAALESLLDSARCVALAGTGGLGKTQLAVEYAYRARAQYPGGVFWLVMDTLGSIAGQVAALAGPDGLALPGA